MHFGSIAALQRADPERIEEVEGVGPIMAVQIAESLADERTAELIAQAGGEGPAARARPLRTCARRAARSTARRWC